MSDKRRLRRVAKAQAAKRQSWAWRILPVDPALFEQYPAVRNVKRVLANDFYIVQFFDVATDIGLVEHLMIRSVKNAAAGPGGGRGDEPPWRDLQRIKDELVGEDLEAVQVCPRKRDVMDQADMFHLWVLPADRALPFGLHRESGFARPEGYSNEQQA